MVYAPGSVGNGMHSIENIPAYLAQQPSSGKENYKTCNSPLTARTRLVKGRVILPVTPLLSGWKVITWLSLFYVVPSLFL